MRFAFPELDMSSSRTRFAAACWSALLVLVAGCFDPSEGPTVEDGTTTATETATEVGVSSDSTNAVTTAGGSTSTGTTGVTSTGSSQDSQGEAEETSSDTSSVGESTEGSSTGSAGDADDTDAPVRVPLLEVILPERGTVSTSITLRGENFGSSQGRSRVLFGDVPAAVTSWSDTEIVAIVPDLLPGDVDVAVVLESQATESQPFTVELPPMVYVSLRNHEAGGNNRLAALRANLASGRLTEISASPYELGETTPRDYGCISTIVLHERTRRLFAINRNSVSVFSVHPRTGELTEDANSPVSTGHMDWGASLQINAAGDRLYVVSSSYAGYTPGGILTFAVTTDGPLLLDELAALEVGSTLQHSALSAEEAYLLTYQTGATLLHPLSDERSVEEYTYGYILAVVWQYLRARPRSSQVFGIFPPLVRYDMAPDGSLERVVYDLPIGPSLAFLPQGDFAYSGVADEPTVHGIAIDEEGNASTADGSPFDISAGASVATCVEVSRSGEYLLVADGSDDTVGLFDIEQETRQPLYRDAELLRRSGGGSTSPTWIVTSF